MPIRTLLIVHQETQVALPSVHSSGGRNRTLRWLLFLSATSLALQVSLTQYGTDSSGTGTFWFVVGGVLLWLVYARRSRVARGLVVLSSLTGAVIYGAGALGDSHAAFLALANLGQALPLLLPPVREHVATRT